MSVASSHDSLWLTPSQQVIWRNYLTVSARLGEQLNADLRKHGLDHNEYEVLVVLSEYPKNSARMSQLAQDTNQSRSRLTHTVNRMETEGLIYRTTAHDDGRGVLACLTRLGEQKLHEAAPDHVASVRRYLVDPISEEDWAGFGRAMQAVLDNAAQNQS